MTAMPHRMDRVREIFDRAMELEPAAQAAFLASECGQDEFLRRELESLLHLHAEARDVLGEPAPGAGEKPGDRIGHFKLLQKIGEGGFGTVWMAEQEQPVRRKVALKVLKPGMDTALVIGRFEAERQALALMDHPYIAKVFDGGATVQGRPYFVMELVKGIPIHRYCDEAGMSTRERLSLFVAVCQAVQHAHQKGIIHRDLKPSNVLVTLHDGHPVPKVIDFGIAKAIQGQLTDRTVFTEFRQMLGTPEYMAPEQAALSGLDVDTRADIYSLGVLLYELLTGTRPFELKTLLQAGYDAMLQTIKEVDPPKPSTRVSTLGEQITAIARQRRVHPRSLGSLMRGDLDWIVMKAIEKERSRRYDTASALAEDVLRHLRHDPVVASPPGAVYRLRKYVRRHRVGVAAGTAITASLAVGAVLSGLGYLEAKEQSELARAAERRAGEERTAALLARDAEQEQRRLAERRSAEAQRAAAKAKSVVDLLTSTLASSNPHENKGRNYPVRLVLADFERTLGAELQGEPEVEAALRAVVGTSYLGLGMVAAAEPHVLRAIELQRAVHGPRHVDLVSALTGAAYLHHEQARFADALTDLELAEAALPGDGSTAELEQRNEVLAYRSDILRHLGRLEEAEVVSRTVLETQKKLHGDESPAVAMALGRLAQVLEDREDLAGAEELHRAALAMRRKLGRDKHPETATTLHNLALVLRKRADPAGAEALHRESLAIWRESMGDEHPQLVTCLRNLACVLFDQSDLAGAEACQREALALHVKLHGEENPDVAKHLSSLATILSVRGDLASAEQSFRDALALRQRLYGPEHLDVAQSLSDLSRVLLDRGDLPGAEAMGRDALRVRRKLLDAGDPLVGASLNNLALVLLEGKDLAGTEPMLREALAIARATSSDEHVAHHLAFVLESRGDLVGAEEMYREAIATRRALLGTEHSRVADSLYGLAQLLRKRRDLAGAEEAHREALAIRRKLHRNEDPALAASLSALAVVLDDRRQFAEAEQLNREALPLWRKARGDEHLDVATCMGNLGENLRSRGDLGGAERLQRDSLAMRRKLVGAEHESVAHCLSSLGLTLFVRSDLAGAEDCYREALRIRRKLLGDEHLDVATSANDVARVLHVRGDLAGAEQTGRDALGLLQKLLGEEHLDVAACMQMLAGILRDRGDLAGAEQYYRQALDSNRRLRGEEHRNVATILTQLGAVLTRRGDDAEAERCHREALAMRTKFLGEGHPDVATSQAGLARCLLHTKHYAEAEQLATASLVIRAAKRAGTWSHYHSMGLLGRALAGQGKVAEAEPLLVEACTKMKPPTASGDCLREALSCLIALYEGTGRAEQAVPWKEKLRAFETASGAKTPGGG